MRASRNVNRDNAEILARADCTKIELALNTTSCPTELEQFVVVLRQAADHAEDLARGDTEIGVSATKTTRDGLDDLARGQLKHDRFHPGVN